MHFIFLVFILFFLYKGIISLNNISRFVFLMVMAMALRWPNSDNFNSQEKLLILKPHNFISLSNSHATWDSLANLFNRTN
jgi:hypothetical protein